MFEVSVNFFLDLNIFFNKVKSFSSQSEKSSCIFCSEESSSSDVKLKFFSSKLESSSSQLKESSFSDVK